MKLKHVEIRNYRSIKNQSIEFDPRCRVLVGINESGKSNILKALSKLSRNYSTDVSEERYALAGEQIDESYIKFEFSFDDNDISILVDDARRALAVGETVKIFSDGKKLLNLEQAIKGYDGGFYKADVTANNKYVVYRTQPVYELEGEWKKPAATCPDDLKFIDRDGKEVPVKPLTALKINHNTEMIPKEHLVDVTASEIQKKLTNLLCDYIRNHLPQVIFWEYSEKDLMPTHVALSKFMENPDGFIPLRNMFILAGYKDIKKQLQDAKARGPIPLDNLLGIVGTKTTEYLQSVWEECKGITISLSMNGPNIRCTVDEESSFEMKIRSDGFKKFMAFILSVSTTSHTNELKDTLILMDEPDTGLHPSGARYFRDELLKISSSNIVVYSTHSIFMIDNEDIKRHYIVTKDRQTTTLKAADEGNIVKEEVIFSSIKYSVFDHLKEHNVIFEGWWDRKLFEAYSSKHSKAFLKSLGVIHAKGVTSYQIVVPTMEIAKRKCLIVSDNDEAAKRYQKSYNELGYETNWMRYDQIDPTCTAITGEDFLKSEYLVKVVNQKNKKENIALSLTSTELPDDNKLDYIKNKVKNAQKGVGINDYSRTLKETLFKNISSTNIEKRYGTFVSALKNTIIRDL